MDKINMQRTWNTIPGIEKSCGNRHNRIHPPQGQTKGQKGNLREISLRYQNSENRDSQEKTHCRRKSYRLSRRCQHTNIRLDRHETPY